MTRETAQSAEGEPTKKVSSPSRFGPDGFALLAELRTQEGAGAEWFAPRKEVYARSVREPLIATMEQLAREVIWPLVNDTSMLGDDTLVTETKRTLARINAQRPRSNGSMYYPYLWASFFPASHERRQTAAQLFVSVHSEGVDVGMSVGGGPAEARTRLRAALEGPMAARLAARLSAGSPALRLRHFTLDDGPDAGPGEEATPQGLLERLCADESDWSLVVRLSPEEAGSPEPLERALRRVLPFYVLALVEPTGALLDVLGVPPAAEEQDTPVG